MPMDSTKQFLVKHWWYIWHKIFVQTMTGAECNNARTWLCKPYSHIFYQHFWVTLWRHSATKYGNGMFNNIFFIYPYISFSDSCDHLTNSLWCASNVWGPVNQHLMHHSHCTTIMIRKWTEGMYFIVSCLLKDAISNNLMSSLLAP
jgi:hypothetical protein